jgi:hypothetical protein
MGTQVQRSQRSDVMMVDVSKPQSLTERCVTLETKADGKNGLGFSECSAAHSVLCEVNDYFFTPT